MTITALRCRYRQCQSNAAQHGVRRRRGLTMQRDWVQVTANVAVLAGLGLVAEPKDMNLSGHQDID